MTTAPFLHGVIPAEAGIQYGQEMKFSRASLGSPVLDSRLRRNRHRAFGEGRAMSTTPERLNLTPEQAIELIAERARAIAEARPGRVAIGLAGGPGVGTDHRPVEAVNALNRAWPPMCRWTAST